MATDRWSEVRALLDPAAEWDEARSRAELERLGPGACGMGVELASMLAFDGPTGVHP